jgi:transcriptional regulator with XRE-family HTH domain
MTQQFSEKLRLVLKMLSMTSAQLASGMETDKSVVSRWLKGSTQPSAHNLSRLSSLIAERIEGFRTLDWERDLQGIAAMFGAPPESINAIVRQSGKLPLAIWDQMVATTMLRGKAYEGFFRSTRPHPVMPGRFAHDFGMMRHDENGLLHLTMGSAGSVVDGWMFALHGQLVCIASDTTGGTMLFGIFNGIGGARVEVFDGVILIPGFDMARSPTAMAMLCERVGDLSGDREADEKHFAELAAQNPLAPEGSIPEQIRKHLVRDIGPAQHALGGDWLLTMPTARSMTRGPDFDKKAGP